MTYQYGGSLLVGPSDAYPVPVYDRLTPPEYPGRPPGGAWEVELAHAWYSLGYGDEYREQSAVTAEKALTYSAVWGCVRVIAQALAAVGWSAFERSADGRTRLPLEDNEAWLIDLQANPEMSALEWRQVMLKDALTWGNGYAEIERNGYGRANWLWRLDPSRVAPGRDGNGKLIYTVDNGRGADPTVLPPENVFHLKGMGADGIMGYSVVHMAKKAIQLGMSEEGYGLAFFGRGPLPGGILKVPGAGGPAEEKKRTETRRSFEEAYGGGIKNARRIVVLSGGAEFTPFDVPNDDAQFLESRRFQVNEICRWYGVPPHKLADLERATFSNVEEQELAFTRDCLLPWARRLETEADIKLYGPIRRGRRFTKLNLDALLRGNSSTQTSTVVSKVTSGLMTVNEGRAYFDMNPIDGGDTPLIQGAMTPLERVLEGPEPVEPASDPADPAETPDQQAAPADLSRVRSTFGGLLAAAFARMVRVEQDKARRAANKGKLAEWAAEYYGRPAAVGHVAAEVRPALEALLLALGRDPAGAAPLADDAAKRHVKRGHAGLAEGGAAALEKWDGRAVESAAELITEVIG